MAKRMTDTNKWRKPFIRGLDGAYKLFWMYLLDDCDHAGVWIIDMDVAEIRVGEKLDLDTAREHFKDRIVEFDSGERWFIPDFVEFQYGELNPANRAHNSVINALKKYNLFDNYKALISPLQEAKDKDKDKVKEKDKEKVKEKIPELIEFINYAKEKKADVNIDSVTLKYESWKVAGWKDGNGKDILNWKSKLLNTIPYMQDKKKKNLYPGYVDSSFD